MFQGGVGGQNRIVWLDDSSSDLRCGVYSELKFALLAIINRQPFHEQGSEARTSATTEGVEDEETLKAGAVVRQFTKAVEDDIHNLFSYGVVTTGVVVGGILLTSNELLWVEQLSVHAGSDLVCKEIYTLSTANILDYINKQYQ